VQLLILESVMKRLLKSCLSPFLVFITLILISCKISVAQNAKQNKELQPLRSVTKMALSAETQKPSIGPDYRRQIRKSFVPDYLRVTKSTGLPRDQIMATGTSFGGSDFDDNSTENGGYLFIPPDPIGAAGIDRLIAVVNVMIEARDKTGVLLWRDALKDFFAPLSPVNFTFDPKVVYDHYEDRFVVVTLERVNTGINPDPGNGNTSRILVAVSKSATPATATSADWYYHSIDAEESIGGYDHWVDYPGFELDEEAVYITGNMFAHTGGITNYRVRLWIIDKGVSGGFYDIGSAAVTKHNLYDGYGTATTTMPALVYGSGGAGTGIGTYLVSFSGLHIGSIEYIQVVRVDDPLGSPTFYQEYVNIGNIDNLSSGLPDASQSGTDTLIEVNDRRALDAVWRNDALWLTTTINPNSGSDIGQTSAHWIKLNTSVPGTITLEDQGNIGGEDIHPAGEVYTFFPSLAVNNAGDAYFGFSASSSNIFAGAFCAGRQVSDLPGTIRATETVRAGVDSYVRTFGIYPIDENRWGDYSGTALDPSDDNLFWIFNEYAMLRGTPTGPPTEDGRWATAWASVSFVQTIFSNGVDVALNFSQTSPTPPQSDWPLGQFSLNSSSSGAQINDLTVILSGSYNNLDGPQPFRLFADNSNNFSVASAIGTDAAASGGSVTFSGLADALPSGSRYYWVTADLAAGANGNINGSVSASADLDLAGASLSTSSTYGVLNSGSDVSLPVQLSAFTAAAEDGQIILRWTTQSEIANLGFIIRRSTDFEGPYTELASYTDNEKLAGQGNIADATVYEYYDDRVENGHKYYYTLTDVDLGGKQTTHGPVEATALSIELTTNQYFLSQNYPNPFNPRTVIGWQLAVDSNVEFSIYNILGEKVTTLVSEKQKAGYHEIEFNAQNLPSGIYLYRINAGEWQDVKKMLLLR
jgi:hypothetical protein